MNRYLKNIVVLLLSSFILISNKCSEDNDIILDNDSTISIKNNGNENIDSIRSIKEQEYLKNLEEKSKKQELAEQYLVKNLTKDDLKSALPKSISGFNALPTITGKTQETDTSFTIYVKQQFKSNQNKTIMFDIYDYGKGNIIPNKIIYDIPPQDLDAPSYPIQLSNAKGYFYWLEQKVYGHIEVLVENRFVIIVRLNGFNRDDKLLENYLKLVKIKDLISKTKKLN